MRESCKFSVIIPTYNRADLLDRCLDSLTRQSFKDFEVLVCDDGSTDDSRVVAERYRDYLDLRYLWEENWGGPARPRNRGIQAARGEWICFLDSDDWWTPDKLEACLPYLDDNDVIYHNLWIYQEGRETRSRKLKVYQPRKPVFIDMLLHDSCMPNSSVCIRRTMVERIGLFSEDKELIAVEDYDYWLRLSLVTDRFAMIDKILGYYWVGPTSISAGPKWITRHDAIYAKYLPLVKDARTRKRIEKQYNYSRAVICIQIDNAAEAKRTLCRAFDWQNSVVRNLKIMWRLVFLLLRH